MKRYPAIFTALLLFPVMFCGETFAQAEHPDPPVAGKPKELVCQHTFSFGGGKPRDFLRAVEKMFQDVDFLSLPVTNANWSAGWQERLRAAERELKAQKIDWSIAEIPTEMDWVRLPAMRFTTWFEFVDGRLKSPHPFGRVHDRLMELIAVYNRLGQQKPELGKLVVEWNGENLLKPSVVMLVPNAQKVAEQRIRVKAFPLAGIPEPRWDRIVKDIREAEIRAQEYQNDLRIGGPAPPGMASIHRDTSLLVATGSEAYVDMVESIVAAHRKNWDIGRAPPRLGEPAPEK